MKTKWVKEFEETIIHLCTVSVYYYEVRGVISFSY